MTDPLVIEAMRAARGVAQFPDLVAWLFFGVLGAMAVLAVMEVWRVISEWRSNRER